MDKNILLEICKNSSFRLFLISSIVCRSNTKNGGNFSLAPLYRLIAATGSNEGIKLAKKIVTDCIVHRVHPATQIRKIKRMNQVIDGLGAFSPELQGDWAKVKSVLEKFGLSCLLNLVEGLITVPADKLSCSIAATGPIEGMRLARKIVTDCIVHRVHPAFQFKKFKMNPVNQVIDGLGALLF
ncbi:unnamed protein product [Prunus armeniaca]